MLIHNILVIYMADTMYIQLKFSTNNGTPNNLTNKLNINGTCFVATFSGSGASLTNIPYTNIAGLPTSFQNDWNSTVINKPSTFNPDLTNIYTRT